MAKRAVILLIALLLVLGVTSVAWAQGLAPSGSAVISNIGTSTITVQAAPATWVETGRMGTHEGTVYKEFRLVDAAGKDISLAQDNVLSITVKEPGGATKTLTPNTDPTLWFNVTKPAGSYEFTITLKDNAVYAATLTWTGPMQLLDITWDLPETFTATVNQSFAVNTTAAISAAVAGAGVTEIGRVLYIIEVTKGGIPVTPADVIAFGPPAQQGGQAQQLGYDDTGKFFYWGPRTGFTFSTSMYDQAANCVKTTFTVTFKTMGTYVVKAYAVQLP